MIQTNYRDILKVVLPLSFGSFVQFIVVFTDNYFVAQLGENAMSGASFIGLIYVSLMMLGMGLSNAAQIIIARRQGEHRYDEAGRVFANTFIIAFFLAILQVLISYFIMPMALEKWIASDEIRSYANEFLEIRSFGFLFYTLTLIINSFWAGIAQTRVMAYTTLITASVNVVLDYGLVFGAWGLPQMGIRGAALATDIAEACAFLYALIYTLSQKRIVQYELKKALQSKSLQYTKQLLVLGGPIMLRLGISLSVWAVFFLFVEKLGEKQFQASHIVRNMYMLVWISVMGFSSATKTYVSTLIAEKRQEILMPTIRKLMLMNFTGVLLLSHGLWLYPEWIASLFTDDAETIQYTVDCMLVILPAMLTFSITNIMLNMVEGSGNTVAGFLVEFTTMIVYISLSYYITIIAPQPIHIVWMADYLYFALLGLLSILFLYNGKWKYREV
ncbi:MAG: MATE family efflux transporter [Flavobacteriales bacterium]